MALPGAGAETGVAFVQFEGLNAAAGETISFDINAAPVPVPTALPLLLPGVGGLGLLFRRRTTAPI